MAISVQMPALGESVTEGTVTRWLKQEGDTVEEDEPLLEVSTDKVDTEIPSPAAGVLKKIVAQEDDTVEVGGELAVIGDADDSDAGGDEKPEPEPEPEPEAEAEPEPAPEPEPEPEAKPKAKPAQSSGSATPVLMPELGESVTEGTVTRWLKKIGDSVDVDEPLVEVSTDKVDTEIPSPVAGTLLSITAEEDDTVEVGGELAKIGDAGAEAAPEPEPEPEPQPEPEPKTTTPSAKPAEEAAPEPKPEPTPQPKPEPAPAAAAESSGDSSPYVTPLVRKLAGEHSVDLASVKGTGVGGRIRKQDVLAAAEASKAPKEAPKAAPAAEAPAKVPTPAPEGALAHLRGTTQKANRIRQITAKKTRESLQTTAQLTQVHEVDMTKIVALRAKAKAKFAEREGVNLTYLPFIARAVIDALKIHPNVNASYNEDSKEITYYDAEHLGVAVDTEQGLLSPVIHNAGDLSLGGLARAISDIAARARSGDLKPDELSGGTFTITNIGSQGALFDTPILVPPQAAMLGTGAIVKRPRVIVDDYGNESIGVRSVSYLPLTYDHRLIDGADAGRFVTTIKRRLEEGAFEADLGL
ncbi:2-oxoglutarate dehydrogenase, E2 component, dihydrolipoamide succinyltransferase [Mycolicibacterium vanbaalenii]|jgi:2-oxoglutarate dehydrogenase E2 component (dihydrolipoamide succinyltransferase)|uniref:2-oxoglutarate dehydrogenase, E2 component, dihydrolipoamide succinyltransferase n=1 Tax=Mycolicibacterium TaxID=1866885 RepID=UPI001F172188|nr:MULTISPECIES: 2-oxoglutarate dehydrogenase, E2 component, dihydrolipoamide succinyltransferase [Mycolicibacterium]MDW5612848.1 2-oxoglutarate dehydrogenase, E2 component, dihydrolipoamide succinyltransferase [Mycolicibacterium sp. D5.8-2]UJL27979.1 2-oxoglutarate dehydrogenase, E2 component, dihydrolipoamide succinyltransferase [Mycolicibacterium vanbaalenii]WND54665.1 2-oxoglutarate dehydrogenase, E2 component, dihydrolipoamide succinyltransferase [Mycolicibacterium vanbaalenii]